jgi:CDGSH-type Zn-finger protein
MRVFDLRGVVLDLISTRPVPNRRDQPGCGPILDDNVLRGAVDLPWPLSVGARSEHRANRDCGDAAHRRGGEKLARQMPHLRRSLGTIPRKGTFVPARSTAATHNSPSPSPLWIVQCSICCVLANPATSTFLKRKAARRRPAGARYARINDTAAVGCCRCGLSDVLNCGFSSGTHRQQAFEARSWRRGRCGLPVKTGYRVLRLFLRHRNSAEEVTCRRPLPRGGSVLRWP